jgi:hypothetical protein
MLPQGSSDPAGAMLKGGANRTVGEEPQMDTDKSQRQLIQTAAHDLTPALFLTLSVFICAHPWFSSHAS